MARAYAGHHHPLTAAPLPDGGVKKGRKIMSKKALCIGINDYPGTQNDLSGCVNNAND